MEKSYSFMSKNVEGKVVVIEKESSTYAELSIDDAPRTAETRAWWEAQNGRQAGEPAKLAQALITIASEEQPPRRFVADAIAIAEQKVAELQEQIDAYGDLSTSLALNDLPPAANRR
jgi:hypothetical protein